MASGAAALHHRTDVYRNLLIFRNHLRRSARLSVPGVAAAAAAVVFVPSDKETPVAWTLIPTTVVKVVVVVQRSLKYLLLVNGSFCCSIPRRVCCV